MTIREAIEQIDDLKHNTYTAHQKHQWLMELESRLRSLLERCGCTASSAQEDFDAPLLAQPPYDAMYIHYLVAQMDYHNEEFDRYNNAMAMFSAVFDDFRRTLSRTCSPHGARYRYF